MKVLLLAVLLAILTGVRAEACQEVSPARQAKINAQQRSEFATLVRQTAADAEAIYIATVQEVTAKRDRATFRIDRVIKGRVAIGSTIAFDLPDLDSFVLSCGGPEEFGNIIAVAGDSVILYIIAGHPVRSAPIERGKTNLPFSEELHLTEATHGT